LHILAAARFTNWHYDSENHKTGKDSKYSKNMLVPYLGITYDLTPKHSVYASYTTIDKPQTVRDMNNNLLKPITGTNYEIGWKADWFGNGELNTALSLFRIEQKIVPTISIRATAPVNGHISPREKSAVRVLMPKSPVVSLLTGNSLPDTPTTPANTKKTKVNVTPPEQISANTHRNTWRASTAAITCHSMTTNGPSAAACVRKVQRIVCGMLARAVTPCGIWA
jgi:outer membrane receptor for fe(III)-coprogen